MYPNVSSSNGIIHFETEELISTIKVLDINSNIFSNYTIKQGTNNFKLHNVPPGLYLVMFEIKNNILIKKLLIK